VHRAAPVRAHAVHVPSTAATSTIAATTIAATKPIQPIQPSNADPIPKALKPLTQKGKPTKNVFFRKTT
jgi:hypothetical protein